MNKLKALRDVIVEAHPELEVDPDRLLTFVEQGSIAARYPAGRPSFENRYTATVFITDYTGDPHRLFAMLLDWYRKQQPDDLLDPARHAAQMTYEVDIIDGKTVDLMIKVPLTERVVATADPAGGWQVAIQPEPDYLAGTVPGSPLVVQLGDDPVAVIGPGAGG